MSDFAAQIFRIRTHDTALLPSRPRVHAFLDDLLGLLFPQLSPEPEYLAAAEVEGALALLAGDLRKLLRPQQDRLPRSAGEIVDDFFAELPAIYGRMWLDARAIDAGDPAAENLDEVVAAYPGFFAIATHRLAHALHAAGVPILPRILAEVAHHRTGIDIHPGATIGRSFCIDHGTGVVIGETAVLGDEVKVYQGVSLGALSVAKEMAGSRRHPTIEDRVVIYSNATILGGRTVIGHDSVIGGNVWLTDSVPPWSVVYHKSDVTVRSKRQGDAPIDFSI